MAAEATYAIILMAVLVVAFGVGLYFVSNAQCMSDTACIKVQTTCCPCSAGGQEKCVGEKEAEQIKAKLKEECQANQICPMVYNCKEITCGCKNTKCVEK